MVLVQPLVLCATLCCLSCLRLFYHEVVASAGAMEEDTARMWWGRWGGSMSDTEINLAKSGLKNGQQRGQVAASKGVQSWFSKPSVLGYSVRKVDPRSKRTAVEDTLVLSSPREKIKAVGLARESGARRARQIRLPDMLDCWGSG